MANISLGRHTHSVKQESEQYTGPPAFNERGGSYGVGMVGVGAGIGTFGR
jgi:hypothetical protein